MGKYKKQVLDELKSHANKEFASHHLKFFKTGKGEYGEGDMFLGLKVPQQRETAKKYCKYIDLKDVEKLLQNKFHEVRLTALIILTEKYKKSSDKDKKEIVKIYLRNIEYINNWDLVDLSAPYIVGNYWFYNGIEGMMKLAKSGFLWSERIAVLSTFYFIKHGRFGETLELAESFLGHKHDLIHKAAGWMLREAGKRDAEVLYGFLDKHYRDMPRTMLRYSIEKIPEKKRRFYMGK